MALCLSVSLPSFLRSFFLSPSPSLLFSFFLYEATIFLSPSLLGAGIAVETTTVMAVRIPWEVWCRDMLSAEPPRVALQYVSFKILGRALFDSLALLCRLHGVVDVAVSVHDDAIRHSETRRAGVSIFFHCDGCGSSLFTRGTCFCPSLCPLSFRSVHVGGGSCGE